MKEFKRGENMSILVLGGAGYIGSHAVDQLIVQDYEVVVIDNLQTGHKEAVHKEALFYQGDIRDKIFMQEVFHKEKIEAVIHFAANSLVGESVEQPLLYFNNNVYGTQIVLEVMAEYGVKKIVFSSSAATYGEPKEMPITETTATRPENPYGESKLMMEKMMKWCDEAHGLRYVALRYFNVAGAKANASIGEDHDPETHLIPIMLETALGQRAYLGIYGDDYDTPDGTCIRDYVYIEDLIAAHIAALEYLEQGNESSVFNLGSNTGYSVKQMLEAARAVTGKEIPSKLLPRRLGDPSKLVASSVKARTLLGWEPQVTDIKQIIKTAWDWHLSHPKGYDSTE